MAWDDLTFRDQGLFRPGAECPPSEAERPSGDVFYRFINEDSPDPARDFLAWADEPQNKTKWDEHVWLTCKQCAVSLFRPLDKATASLQRLQKIPKWSKNRIGAITLTGNSGAIMETNKETGNYEWWPAENFNIQNHLLKTPEGETHHDD